MAISFYDGMINVCHTAIGGLEGVTDICKDGERIVHQHYVAFCRLGEYCIYNKIPGMPIHHVQRIWYWRFNLLTIHRRENLSA
jgi:hypothetical protein